MLALAPLSASAPVVASLTAGGAGWSALGLIAAPVAVVSVVAVRVRRESAPEMPESAPGWSATWSDYSGTVVRGERSA